MDQEMSSYHQDYYNDCKAALFWGQRECCRRLVFFNLRTAIFLRGPLQSFKLLGKVDWVDSSLELSVAESQESLLDIGLDDAMGLGTVLGTGLGGSTGLSTELGSGLGIPALVDTGLGTALDIALGYVVGLGT